MSRNKSNSGKKERRNKKHSIRENLKKEWKSLEKH